MMGCILLLPLGPSHLRLRAVLLPHLLLLNARSNVMLEPVDLDVFGRLCHEEAAVMCAAAHASK